MRVIGKFCLMALLALQASRLAARAGTDGALMPLPDIAHSFSHFDLVITPLVARCRGESGVREGAMLWYDLAQPARVGLPAPIKTLLGTLLERNES